MKWMPVAYIATWVVFCAFQQPSAPHRQADKKAPDAAQTDSTPKQKPAQPTTPLPASNTDTDSQRIKSDSNENIQIVTSTPEKPIDLIERIISIIGVLCTVALVIVGIRGIYIALGTLREMKGQREEMGRQVEAALWQVKSMGQQVTEMTAQTALLESSVGVSRDAVKVAQDSANAANKSIEITIDKERARLVIQLTDTQNIGLEIQEEGFPYHRTKNIALTHHGPTSAFNVTGSGIIFISKGEIPVDGEEPKWTTITLPAIMRPDSPPHKVEIFGVLEFGDVTDATKGDSTLHIKALIEYDDVFGNRRKTPFWYIWDVVRFQPDETIDHWEEISEWIPWGGDANKAD